MPITFSVRRGIYALLISCLALPAVSAFAQTVATTPATRPSQAAVLAANTVTHLNVPYGGPDSQLDTLDIYAPKDAKNIPVLLFIHGGEWSRGDKSEVSSKPKFFNENNVIFVSANYRLSPKDKHPAQVDDVATAIAFLHDHIAEYGGDPRNIVILGHSAGCHLVTLVALNPESLAKVGLKTTAIKGVIALSGDMYDLAAQAKTTSTYVPFIKATFGDDAAAQEAASPMHYVSAAKNGPPFLITAVDDPKKQVSRDASKALVDAINAAGGKAQVALLIGKTHGSANQDIGAPNDKTGPMLLDFIHAVTR